MERFDFKSVTYKTTNVRLTTAIFDKIKDVADKETVSFSEAIEVLLKVALEEYNSEMTKKVGVRGAKPKPLVKVTGNQVFVETKPKIEEVKTEDEEWKPEVHTAVDPQDPDTFFKNINL